ncbi:hypothetical protein CTAYLR_008128 [Chrysophaeum taylorii]|uniref:JmjC domain-containing protein n=1 Tax=Chrysophaeum taylorii TaxID=2483200 RepID=A0AAD7UL79_9STRA|nr:hypothetical protein CTAYLR_008128 [Chrysophaeum taylorii]
MEVVVPAAEVARERRRAKRERSEEPSVGFVVEKIAALRRSRPSVPRDISLARWLEYLSRSEAENEDRLCEALGLLERAVAVASKTRRVPRCWLRDVRRLRLLLAAAAAGPRPAVATRVVPIVSAEEACLGRFLRLGTPVLVRGGGDVVFGSRRWTLETLFDELPPDAVAEIKEPAPGRWAGLEVRRTCAARDFVAAPRGYLHDWSLPRHAPGLLDGISIPRWIAGDYLQRCGETPYAGAWPSLFVGPQGTRSALHVDAHATHFAMALASGAKDWRVWPADRAPFLGPRFSDTSEDLLFDDDDRPAPFEITQLPGDLIVVPSNCPHAVDNADTTVALAINFVNATNADDFLESFAIAADDDLPRCCGEDAIHRLRADLRYLAETDPPHFLRWRDHLPWPAWQQLCCKHKR